MIKQTHPLSLDNKVRW